MDSNDKSPSHTSVVRFILDGELIELHDVDPSLTLFRRQLPDSSTSVDNRLLGGFVHAPDGTRDRVLVLNWVLLFVYLIHQFEEHGVDTGAFHPLQTMPTPDLGARRLAGAWVAVTAVDPLRSLLVDLAVTMGCRPFDLDDRNRAAYHAAAAAAAGQQDAFQWRFEHQVGQHRAVERDTRTGTPDQ